MTGLPHEANLRSLSRNRRYRRLLVENEYIDSTDEDYLNPVLISPLLENAIRAFGQDLALPVFNCLNCESA